MRFSKREGIGKLWLLPWAGLLLAVRVAAQDEEPVRRAEPAAEEVRAAEPHEEPVRKAERAAKPPTNTGAPIHAGQPVRVVVESPKEGEVMPWETVDVFVRAENYSIGDGGNRLQVIVDNGSPIEHASDLKPVVLHGLAPGAHVLRVYAVKPDGKMLADPEARARVNFYVRRKDFSNFQPEDHPHLTVNLPKDGLAFPDPEGKVWLDFHVHNATLAQDGYRVRGRLDGVETILSSPDPYAWAGLSEGRHRLVVELIDEEGDPVSEIFARVERTFEIPRMVKAVNPQQVDEANLWLRNRSQTNADTGASRERQDSVTAPRLRRPD